MCGTQSRWSGTALRTCQGTGDALVNFSHLQKVPEIHLAPSMLTLPKPHHVWLAFHQNTYMFVWDAFFPLQSAWPFTIIYILYNLQHVSSIFNGVVLSHVFSIVVWKTSWSGGARTSFSTALIFFNEEKVSPLKHCWPLSNACRWRKSWTLNVRPGVGWCLIFAQAAIKPSPQHRETDRILVV